MTSQLNIPENDQQPNASMSNDSYTLDPAVDALNPTTPETLNPALSSRPSSASTSSPSVRADGVGGMTITPDTILDENRLRTLVEPFGSEPAPRPPAREIFKPETAETADSKLLERFVTAQRLRELWMQLEALQEEVVQSVKANRTNTDAYQQDLLYASSLLLQSTANYDESRQIMYRVRADLKRELKVQIDIDKYSPRLYLYYTIWFALWIVFTRFDDQFRALMPDSLPILKLAYSPILFGTLGALFNGVMALFQHTSIRRDFDPVHISWYIINPLIGGVLGLVTFIFFVVAGSSFTPNLPSNPGQISQAPLAIWLIAFLVGWQQNIIFKLLNRLLNTVADPPSTTTSNVDVATPVIPTKYPPAQG